MYFYEFKFGDNPEWVNIPSVSSGSDRNLSSRQRVSKELVAEVYGNYDEGCQQFRHRNGKPQSFCRYLCKECGETNFSHVAYVAQSKRQGSDAHFQTIELQWGREPDKQPVEYNIGDGSCHLCPHGISWRTVKTDKHHAHALQEKEGHARQYSRQMVDGKAFQLLTAP